jgi:acetate kinase
VLGEAVIPAIHELEALAPLHNGPSLAGIRACRAALGGIAMAIHVGGW